MRETLRSDTKRSTAACVAQARLLRGQNKDDWVGGRLSVREGFLKELISSWISENYGIQSRGEKSGCRRPLSEHFLKK